MKKRILLPLLVAAFSLAIAGGCKKKDEGAEEGADPAAKPTEGEEMAAGDDTPDEGADEGGEETADEGGDEGGDEAGGEVGKTGIDECDQYVDAVMKYVECDKVPDQAREATKKGLEGMKKGWGDIDNMPDEAKTAAADSCKTALDALQKGAEAIGCEI